MTNEHNWNTDFNTFTNIDKITERFKEEMVEEIGFEIDRLISKGFTLLYSFQAVKAATQSTLLEEAFFQWVEEHLEKHKQFREEDF